MKKLLFLSVLFLIHLIESVSSIRTVFLDRNCGSIITISQEPQGVLKLSLTSNDVYAQYMDCHVTITANQNVQIGVTFLDMNIMGFQTCQSDYLQIYDGVEINNSTFLFTSVHDHHQLCGKRLPPNFGSRHNNLTFRFVSDALYSSKGFLLLLTAFHTGSCRGDEFQCSNSRCIDEDLHCDEDNNCGDGSDICQLSIYIILGLAFSSLVLVIALVVLCAVLHYRFVKRPSSDELDFDSVSIGTECTDCEPDVPGGVSTTTSSSSSGFPGISNRNIISVITRSNMDDDTNYYSRRETRSRTAPATEHCSSRRSYWLHHQLGF